MIFLASFTLRRHKFSQSFNVLIEWGGFDQTKIILDGTRRRGYLFRIFYFTTVMNKEIGLWELSVIRSDTALQQFPEQFMS